MIMQKINQLKEIVKLQSVNNLTAIEPKWLQEKLGLGNKEFEAFRDFLFREGVLKYRYRFNCSQCQESCIEYVKIIKKGRCRCGSCGKNYNLEVMDKKAGHIVYELLKDGILAFGEDDMEDVNLDESNVVSLELIKNIGKEKRTMAEEKKEKVIFFGSSKEAVDTMDEAAAIVSNLGCKTLTWNSPNNGVFVAGNSILDSLLETADRVDGAVFIFNRDDEVWCRDEVKGSVRDNVLFEYGLFMGKLNKQKVVFVCKNRPDLASDLSGIIYIDANKEAEMRQALKLWLQRI